MTVTPNAKRRRLVVVGGGIAGCSAALTLARAGHEVVVCEAGPNLGGLVVSFTVDGTPLECFYHHVFPHERDVLGLIDDLGLGAKMEWRRSTVGVYTGGRVWPFTSAADLLRFRPLPLADRLRTGLGALRMGRVRAWEPLDAVPARDWLAAHTGSRSMEVVWDPLLRAKFGPAAPDVPAAWMWARFRQRAAARANGMERLGYLRGGFRQLFDALGSELRVRGAVVRCDASVERILLTGGAAGGVALRGGERLEADGVVYAGPLPLLPPLLPESVHDRRWTTARGLGALCVVLELRGPLTPVYWTNVCDGGLPFGGIIEHTNLVPPADYGDRHVVYLIRYFTHAEPVATADPAGEADRWVRQLAARFEGLEEDQIAAVHPFRARYAAPLVALGHARGMPPMASHLPGLTVCTTAQIYPQDRGMSEGVRLGRVAAGVAAAGLDAARVARTR